MYGNRNDDYKLEKKLIGKLFHISTIKIKDINYSNNNTQLIFWLSGDGEFECIYKFNKTHNLKNVNPNDDSRLSRKFTYFCWHYRYFILIKHYVLG